MAQHPQSKICKFWEVFHSDITGKITSVFPHRLYDGLVFEPKASQEKESNAAQSYQAARSRCISMMQEVINQCERTNTKFTDPDFDIADDHYLSNDYCLYSLDGSDSNSDTEEDIVSLSEIQCALGTIVKSHIMRDDDAYVNLKTLVAAMDKECVARSRARPKSVHRVDWIFEAPKFTVDGYSSTDIIQGAAGDCWWLAAVASIAHRQDLMDKLCVARNESCGVYGFTFYRDGHWFPVVIDDNLYLRYRDYEVRRTAEYDVTGQKAQRYRKQEQTGSEALYFAQCAEKNETWLPLLEKAYAKAHGDYESIEGGCPGAGVEDLTGGVSTSVLCSAVLDKNRLWQEILSSGQAGGDFVFSVSSTAEAEIEHKQGIALNHSYSIITASEIEDERGVKVRLVKIRNPWGRRAQDRSGDWEGPWSNGSVEWTAHTIQRLGHQFGDDGSSWMTLEDLLQGFKTIHRCRLFNEKWIVTQQWTSEPIPWLAGYLRTKFIINIKHACLLVVTLAQLDGRYFKGLQGQYTFDLGFKVRQSGSLKIVGEAQGPTLDRRSVNCEVNLPAGAYEIRPRITAEYEPQQQAVESQVKSYALKSPTKLRQVGMRHDSAHASVGLFDKGVASPEGDLKEINDAQKINARSGNTASGVEPCPITSLDCAAKSSNDHRPTGRSDIGANEALTEGNEPLIAIQGDTSFPSSEANKIARPRSSEGRTMNPYSSSEASGTAAVKEDLNDSAHKEPTWNPVCVFGLRVHSQGEDVQIWIERDP